MKKASALAVSSLSVSSSLLRANSMSASPASDATRRGSPQMKTPREKG
ncbi:MAG: hypothetical protein HY884_03100 [Deltaproteobacteria bacterium]|nr:hypothetical protein [Deltaproteobacteria bacterium]